MDEERLAGGLAIDRDRLADLCRRHHILTLQVFGSALREDFTAGSDVDLLVEFDADHVPGFLRLHAIAEELSECFQGRRVDLVTVQALSPRLRTQVLSSAEVLFAA